MTTPDQVTSTSQPNSGSSPAPTLLMGALLGLALAGGIYFGPGLLAGLGSTDPKVVVIDAVRIVEAASKQAMDMQVTTPEAAVKMGEEVASKLNTEMTAYASKGAIVIVKQAVLAAPAATDVTEEIAARIGVDVSRVPGR